ncbi:MAG TPA: hypothetical protein VMB77_01915 [Syntrophales bacterium]|nr:hypothetical protein [Syntrophales bacterium]
MHLQVMHQTFKDKNIWIGKKKPEILDEYASTLSAMSRDGIKFEICLIAMKLRDSLSIVHPEDRERVRKEAIDMRKGRRSVPY